MKHDPPVAAHIDRVRDGLVRHENSLSVTEPHSNNLLPSSLVVGEVAANGLTTVKPVRKAHEGLSAVMTDRGAEEIGSVDYGLRCTVKGHAAECPEANGRDTVVQGSRCTWKCPGGSSPSTEQSRCVCSGSGYNLICAMNPAVADVVCKDSLSATKNCFPSSSMVLRPDGGQVSIAALQPGDRLLSLGQPSLIVEDTFLGDTHAGDVRQKDGSHHEFLEIWHVSCGSRPLRVTAEHLVFVVDLSDLDAGGRLLPAGSIDSQKHAVLAVDADETSSVGNLIPSQVTHVSLVWAQGVHNPVTSSGTVIVDGVATSNYALVTPTLQKAWKTFPAFRENAETVAWVITLLPRAIGTLGMPAHWWNQQGVLDSLVSIVDFVGSVFLWFHGEPDFEAHKLVI